jgi:hypothetical protein
MESYWSVEHCAWVEYRRAPVGPPEQRAPSDDDAAPAPAEELLAEHVGLAT